MNLVIEGNDMQAQILKDMLKSLQNCKEPRDILLARAIQARLDQSLSSYVTDLEKSQEYLSRHTSHRNIRRLNK